MKGLNDPNYAELYSRLYTIDDVDEFMDTEDKIRNMLECQEHDIVEEEEEAI